MIRVQFLNFDGYAVHDYNQEAFENYLIHGLRPGGFVTAVLANDLFQAAGRADFVNREHLASVASWVYQNCPAQSFGSYQAVEDWCEDRDGRRTAYTEPMFKQKMWRALQQV